MSQLLNDPPEEFPNNFSETQETATPQLILNGFLSRPQLAKQLGISPRTIDRWQALRQGPPQVRIGRLILYRLSSVGEWLRSREQQSSPRKRPRSFSRSKTQEKSNG